MTVAEQYVLHEHDSYGGVKCWLVEDNGQDIRKIKSLNKPYNGQNGKVVTYYDPTVIDPQATARRVEAEHQLHNNSNQFTADFERWLEEQEVKCDD